MAQAGSLSDEWELLPANHDILSCSDTETSDGGEIDSQEASAIIEAIGEAPSAGLQGLTLGSFPQFLGGWYGSCPPAAGRTFTVDLSSTTPDSELATTEGAAAPTNEKEATVVSEDYEDAEDELATGSVDEHETTRNSSTLTKQTRSTSGSSTTTSAPAPAPTAAAAPDASSGYAVLLCLAFAAAVAILLLLLSTSAAGTVSYRYTPALSISTPITPHAFHTTSAEAFQPFVTNNRPRTVLRRFPGANRKLYTPMPATATVAADRSSSSSSVAGSADVATEDSSKRQLPWWLQHSASTTPRRSTAGSPGQLPALPHSLQQVVDDSMRVNMSPSQRLRLFLWLAHCAARNASTARGASQVGASRPAGTTTNPPFPSFTTPRHALPARPMPCIQQCTAPSTVRDWHAAMAATADPDAGFMPTSPVNSAPADNDKGLAGGVQDRTPLETILGFIHPFSRNSRPTSSRSSMQHPFHPAGEACETAYPAAPPPAPTPVTSAPGAPLYVPSPPAAPQQPPLPAAAAVAAAADDDAARQPVIAQPTRPVPPLYRPPLPCLLLGARRPNRTAFSLEIPPAQHGTAAPVGRTMTWPNATARHQQGSGSWSWTARASFKPYGRALAVGMARWGWYQQEQVCTGGPVTLPMLPLLSKPAAMASKQQQQQQQGGLTLPMLPPVVQPMAAAVALTQGAATWRPSHDKFSTAGRQGPGPHSCVTRCAQVCRDPYSCGRVCLERCPGMPDLYSTTPFTGQRFAGQLFRPRSDAIPMPPVQQARSAGVFVARGTSAGQLYRGAIPLLAARLTVRRPAATACAPSTPEQLSAAAAQAAPGCVRATVAHLAQCNRQAHSAVVASCAAKELPALAAAAPGCVRASLKGLAQCQPSPTAATVASCAPAALHELAPASVRQAAPGCVRATLSGLAQCRRIYTALASASCTSTGLPALAPVAGSETAPGCVRATLKGSAQCKRHVPAAVVASCPPKELPALAAAPAGCVRATLKGLAQCKCIVSAAAIASCAPTTLPAPAPRQSGCSAATLPALAQCRRPVAAGAGFSCSPAQLPALAPTAPTCASKHALLAGTSAGCTSYRNTTVVYSLVAAVKLARAAGDLASAAADLASAAAKLATASGGLRSFPPKILQLPAASTPAAVDNLSTTACNSPQLVTVGAAGPANIVSTNSAEAGPAATKWVASLITLPMLPPVLDETDRDTCAGDLESDVVSDTSTEYEGERGGSDCCQSAVVAPLRLAVSHNVTFGSHDEPSDKPRQPMWLMPVM